MQVSQVKCQSVESSSLQAEVSLNCLDLVCFFCVCSTSNCYQRLLLLFVLAGLHCTYLTFRSDQLNVGSVWYPAPWTLPKTPAICHQCPQSSSSCSYSCLLLSFLFLTELEGVWFVIIKSQYRKFFSLPSASTPLPVVFFLSGIFLNWSFKLFIQFTT